MHYVAKTQELSANALNILAGGDPLPDSFSFKNIIDGNPQEETKVDGNVIAAGVLDRLYAFYGKQKGSSKEE